MIGFTYAVLTAYIVMDYFFWESSETEPDGDVKFSKNSKKLIVDIWGKASIAEYFWMHIMEGNCRKNSLYLMEEGEKLFGNIFLKYRTGPFVQPYTVDHNVTNLILILNGREPCKVKESKKWLQPLLVHKTVFNLKNLGIIILGDEHCNNEWLLYYYYKYGKTLKFIFFVYDIDISNHSSFYQWPLGVATYRTFPLVLKHDVDITSKRMYKCNLVATIYENSSRVILDDLLTSHPEFNCLKRVRYEWQPKETKESIKAYNFALKQSDLTLCPVGVNSEAYRIYEALSYGSVPVIEDMLTSGRCGGKNRFNLEGPFRLLKEYQAPVIFIKDWNDLPEVLLKEKALTSEDIVQRRELMLKWYENFRHTMKENFLYVLNKRFLL